MSELISNNLNYKPLILMILNDFCHLHQHHRHHPIWFKWKNPLEYEITLKKAENCELKQL